MQSSNPKSMNIHIWLSDPTWIPIFWHADDQAGTIAPVKGDPWGLNQINPVATGRLRGLLGYALTPGVRNPERLARVISASFEELQPEFLRIERDFELQNTPSFRIPEPLRIALGITDEVMPVEEWICRYPAGATS